MKHIEDQHPTALDKQARLILLGGLFAAGLAAPVPAPAENLTATHSGSSHEMMNRKLPSVDCGLDCTPSYGASVTAAATSTSGTVDVTSASGPGGSIAPQGTQMASVGTATAFTVTPNVGYTIASVTGCGGSLSGNSYITAPITDACTVSASFNQSIYTVTARGGSGGTINPASQRVKYGVTTTFSVTPDTGYTASVTGCGGSLSGNTYTTGGITSACTVSASFSQNSYTVTATAGTGGVISPTEQTVIFGVSTTFTVTPNTGYTADVTGCGGSLSGNTYTTAPITAACIVNASFTEQADALEKQPAPSTALANGSPVSFSVKTLRGGQPISIPVVWTVSPENGAGKLLSGSQRVNMVTVNSDASGFATVDFSPGDQNLGYRITAKAGGQEQSFQINVGSGDVQSDPYTPSRVQEEYTNRACQANQANPTPGMTDLCGQIGSTEPADKTKLYNQLYPRNNPEAANTNQQLAKGQMGNVVSRLSALRQGTRGISVSELNIRQNGQLMSIAAFDKAFAPRGGAAGDEPGADLGGRLGIFVNGTINTGDKNQTIREEGFDYRLYNITSGLDYRFTDSLIAGMALGYAASNADLDASGGGLDATSINLSAYTNYFVNDNIFLDGVLMYGSGNFDLTRNLDFFSGEGTNRQQFIGSATASPDSQQWGIRAGGGYDFKFDQGIQATVSSYFNYLKADLDSYDENGAQINGVNWNLHVNENSLESLTFSLGGEISRTMSMSWGVLTPRLRAEWLHEFKDNPIPITGWYLVDQTGNALYGQSDQQDPDYFQLGLGASAVFSNGVQSFLFYQATLGKADYTDNLITGGIRFEF